MSYGEGYPGIECDNMCSSSPRSFRGLESSESREAINNNIKASYHQYGSSKPYVFQQKKSAKESLLECNAETYFKRCL